MINLGYCRHGRFASAACDALLNRDTWRQTADQINIGFFELFHELSRVWRHAVEKAALSLREQDVKCERRFAGTAQTCDHHQLLARNFQIDVFEIVFARAMNMNSAIVFQGERMPLACTVRPLAERI